MKACGMFVDGGYRASSSGKRFPVVNPKNGSVIAEVAEGNGADIDVAVGVAQRAFGAWSGLSGANRGDIMHRAADLLDKRLPELVALEVDQTGRPWREMQAQLA